MRAVGCASVADAAAASLLFVVRSAASLSSLPSPSPIAGLVLWEFFSRQVATACQNGIPGYDPHNADHQRGGETHAARGEAPFPPTGYGMLLGHRDGGSLPAIHAVPRGASTRARSVGRAMWGAPRRRRRGAAGARPPVDDRHGRRGIRVPRPQTALRRPRFPARPRLPASAARPPPQPKTPAEYRPDAGTGHAQA